MDRRELRRRLAQRPNATRFEELRTLLERYGWSVTRVRSSHVTFRRGGETYVVPRRVPHVLSVYVRGALERTEENENDGEGH